MNEKFTNNTMNELKQKGWKQMESLLDIHMPVQKRNQKAGLWIWLFAIISIASLIWLISSTVQPTVPEIAPQNIKANQEPIAFHSTAQTSSEASSQELNANAQAQSYNNQTSSIAKPDIAIAKIRKTLNNSTINTNPAVASTGIQRSEYSDVPNTQVENANLETTFNGSVSSPSSTSSMQLTDQDQAQILNDANPQSPHTVITPESNIALLMTKTDLVFEQEKREITVEKILLNTSHKPLAISVDVRSFYDDPRQELSGDVGVVMTKPISNKLNLNVGLYYIYLENGLTKSKFDVDVKKSSEDAINNSNLFAAGEYLKSKNYSGIISAHKFSGTFTADFKLTKSLSLMGGGQYSYRAIDPGLSTKLSIVNNDALGIINADKNQHTIGALMGINLHMNSRWQAYIHAENTLMNIIDHDTEILNDQWTMFLGLRYKIASL